MMQSTEIDTAKLKAAVEKCNALLEQVDEIMKPYLVALAARQAQGLPRVRQGIEPAARAMAQNIVSHPDVAKAAGFDARAVTVELEAVNVLQSFADKLGTLAQQVVDTKLRWLVDAYVPALAVNAMVDVRKRLDSGVRTVIEPVARIFKKRPGGSGPVADASAPKAPPPVQH